MNDLASEERRTLAGRLANSENLAINVGWHTPESCPKVIDLKAALAGVHKRMDEGHARMGRIESDLASVSKAVDAGAESRAKVEAKLEANGESIHRVEASLVANSADTAEILSTMHALDGFAKIATWMFKAVQIIAAAAAAVIAFYVAWTGLPEK